MTHIEQRLPLSRITAESIKFWFGTVKGFPEADQVAQFAVRGVPVQVEGGAGVTAALRYHNHSSVGPHEDRLLTKIHEDVVYGRAWVFPRASAGQIPGMRLSPLGVVITSKLRVIHDLSFLHGISKHSVNAGTDFESAPQCNLGHVLCNVVWRVLFLRRRFGNAARIVLSKMDAKDAFRQVAVDAARSPVVGYQLRDLVIVDRRLQFGWRNSPGYWCLFASALEHSHKNTSFSSAVGTTQGWAATAHVVVEPPVGPAQPAPVHPRIVTPPGKGGGVDDEFFVEYYVDDGILVQVQHFASGD